MAYTARRINIDRGSITVDFDAGGTGSVGDCVYIAADGDVERVDADATGSGLGIGIVVRVAGTTHDQLSFAAGDRVTVCVYGKVYGFSGLTTGSLLYPGNTAGSIHHTAPASGDFGNILGYALSTDTIFLQPDNTKITGA